MFERHYQKYYFFQSLKKEIYTSTTKLALESDGMEVFVKPDCMESVLIQEELEPADLMLPVVPDLLPSKSPVLLCFFSLRP